MIQVEAVTHLARQHNMCAEEVFWLFAIDQYHLEPDYQTYLIEYYERNKKRFKYNKIFDRMEKMGFIQNLNRIGEYHFSNMYISEVFRDKLVMTITDNFILAKGYYPLVMEGVFDGVQRRISAFTNLEDDRGSYNRYVVKGNQKNHDAFVELMTRIQGDSQIFPNGSATMKWSTFCKNWEGFFAMHKNQPAKRNKRI